MDGASLSIEKWEQELHQTAATATRLNDFGDPEYLLGLRQLLGALLDTGAVDSRTAAVNQLLMGLLISRLHSERGWKEHADCLRSKVTAPLFIIGMPRTGTTALHRLLAVDPQFQGLEPWISGAPFVRPPRETWPTIPQFKMAAWAIEGRYRKNPRLRSVHYSAAEDVDECFLLLAQNFLCEMFSQLAPIETYVRWLQTADFTPTYRRYADNLKLIGYAEQHRRWLLKDPLHTLHLNALLDVFPDACIVFTHRNPVSVIASTCSLYTLISSPQSIGDVRTLGARTVRSWRDGLLSAVQVRDQFHDRFFDVQYASFVSDAIGTVRVIYERFGLQLEHAVEARMREWLARNTQGKHGQHRYALEDYGLTADTVHEQFAGYIERYRL